MSRDILKDTGVDLLLADTRAEETMQSEGNFELVLDWNEMENSLELKRVIPDDDGNSHFQTLRSLGCYQPMIDIILKYLCKVREEFPQTEIHLESQMADIYFPFKEE